MSEKVIVEREDMVAIADAVRSKTGETDTMTVGEIAAAVYDIESSGTITKTIYDVIELPTSNIKNSFYRLLTAKFVDSTGEVEGHVCYCVNSLPESGQIVTDANMSSFIAYYSVVDNDVYGYVDAA